LGILEVKLILMYVLCTAFWTYVLLNMSSNQQMVSFQWFCIPYNGGCNVDVNKWAYEFW
jgi:hypothetical protein